MYTFKHKKKRKLKKEKLLFGMKLSEVQKALDILFPKETPIIEVKEFLNNSTIV